jgi:hypothetical protein
VKRGADVSLTAALGRVGVVAGTGSYTPTRAPALVAAGVPPGDGYYGASLDFLLRFD